MFSIEANWEQIKETIRNEYGLMDISYSTWIQPLKLYKVENNTVYIIIPMDKAHAINYLEKKYKDYIQVTISEMAGTTMEISFRLEKDIQSSSDSSDKQANPVYNVNYANANLNPKYKFKTFVVGNNNKFAQSAALAVAETPGGAYNPLFLYGGAGLGKTHLMHSIGHFILEQNPEKKVLYVTSEQFTNDVIDSIRSGNASAMTKLRDKYRTMDVLMIDDIQFIIGKESTQEEFFHTFNVLQSAGKQIIISSDRPPKEMETLEDRYRSRFEWGLIADIQTPDYETRVAILQKNAEVYDGMIDGSILEYIANNIQSNVRELEGAFNKIIAYSKINKINLSDITLEIAEEALKDIISPSGGSAITPDMILSVVADHFEVSIDDIKSSKRNAKIVTPRHVFMYLCKSLIPNITLVGIASILNKKDHTTIMHGISNIENEMSKDKELQGKIDIITQILSSS